jgi:PAS domain S-box-containing protein
MKAERVLVVDDDQAFRDLMAAHLQRHGYEVSAASGGAEALEVIQAQDPFAVLVTDLSMPEMDGLELMAEARRLDAWLEVIIITAAGSMDSAITALRQGGAYDYLVKPLESINQLSLAVWRASAHRQLRLERERLQARIAGEAERLRTLIANTADAIMAVDGAGRVTAANEPAARLLGQGDVIGQSAAAGLPRPLAACLHEWQALAGQDAAAVETPWPKGRVSLVRFSSLKGGESDGDGWVMVVSDVTHLRQLDDLRLRLLAEIADQLRLPLSQGAVELAKLRALEEEKSELRRSLEDRLADHLDRVERRMADLSALMEAEAGGARTSVMLDLPGVLREWLEDEIPGPEVSRRVRLAIDDGAAGARLRADPHLLSRLLQQMATLALSKADPEAVLWLGLRLRDRQVWLEVSEAMGASAEGAEAESEAAVPTPALPGEGYEMETALVQAMARILGGQVWLRGRGRESSLAVCLPAASEDDEEGEAIE